MEDSMVTEAMSAGNAERVPFPLQQSETIILICRRHWIHLWPKTVLMAIYAFVPLLVISLILGWQDWYDDVRLFFWLISAAWLLFWALRVYLNWYQYHNDIWVITNQRIVDSIKKHPFSHRLSTADLVNVQDMTVERKGVLQTLLNYGDIVCETASDGGEFVLAGIPRPQDVQLLVDRERDRERKGR
jgi:small-conductance mechanosensitive channel